MIRLNEIKFDLYEKFDHDSIVKKIANKMKIKTAHVTAYKIIRESIDARKGIHFSYTIDVQVAGEEALLRKGFNKAPDRAKPFHECLDGVAKGKIANAKRPVVIGFGPAGMFCAMQLALAGLNPIVFEMGEPVEQRVETVERFWKKGQLNEKSNVQFGEGGAGTFSDGKLTTRIKDNRVSLVLETLIEAGAPEHIAYTHKPHIGTDVLISVVKNIRKKIIDLGGTIYFNSEVTELKIDALEKRVIGVLVNGKDWCESPWVVGATGHSSRKFFECLHESGLKIEAKPFAVGVRIEHPQAVINASQFGRHHRHEKLGAAEYKLSYSTQNGKSVYSFCMCPGGKVVGSASEEGMQVVNGMSYSQRDLFNANSALLVTVETSDFESDHPLAGIAFQRNLEKMAYEVAGGNYLAPAQSLGAFLQSDLSTFTSPFAHYASMGIDYEEAMNALKPTYEPEVSLCDLRAILPYKVTEALLEAIPYFGSRIQGFDDPRAILTGVETRSSSPVRVVRRPDTLESESHCGFYPCGEGAGYAGGITSSAVDGIKIAESIIKDVIK